MTISVIIPTYNGSHKIISILKSLEGQIFKDFELLIIIDGSTDNTLQLLSSIEMPFNYKIIEQENKGRAAVRNKGAELATGELLIFFDDDMRLDPNCINAHIQHQKKYSNSILTGAQIDDYEKATTDFQVYKCDLCRYWASKLNKDNDKPLSFLNLYLTAANFSITKELFNKLGGFNEKLRDCEDYDLALRANNLNIPVYYSESAFAWHDDFQTLSSFIKRQQDYNKYNEILYKLYPEQYSHLLNSRLKKPTIMKITFFSLFQSKKWVKAVDNDLLKYLPKKFRYKLYTWIITAHSTYK